LEEKYVSTFLRFDSLLERFKKNCSRAREGVEGETQLKGGGHRLTTAATTFFKPL